MSSGKLETVHVINEIKDLYYDLQRWIRGDVDEDYSYITKRQARDLTVVGISGNILTLTEFNTWFQKRYGIYPNAKLSTEIVRTKRINHDSLMCIYQLKTDLGEKVYSRMTTAVFKYKDGLKNKCEWVHVHETSMKLV